MKAGNNLKRNVDQYKLDLKSEMYCDACGQETQSLYQRLDKMVCHECLYNVHRQDIVIQTA
jgi:formylmethanofuran dehydrogenase subunit E